MKENDFSSNRLFCTSWKALCPWFNFNIFVLSVTIISHFKNKITFSTLCVYFWLMCSQNMHISSKQYINSYQASSILRTNYNNVYISSVCRKGLYKIRKKNIFLSVAFGLFLAFFFPKLQFPENFLSALFI